MDPWLKQTANRLVVVVVVVFVVIANSEKTLAHISTPFSYRSALPTTATAAAVAASTFAFTPDTLHRDHHWRAPLQYSFLYHSLFPFCVLCLCAYCVHAYASGSMPQTMRIRFIEFSRNHFSKPSSNYYFLFFRESWPSVEDIHFFVCVIQKKKKQKKIVDKVSFKLLLD